MSSVNGGWRGPNIVKDGLVLYLDAGSPNSFFSATAGTTWKDISGNGNNASLVNGPTYSTSIGGSIVFDGSNDYAQINLQSNLLENNFTFSFWFQNNNSADWSDFISFITTTNFSVVLEKGGNNGEPLTNGYLKVYNVNVSSSLSGSVTPGLLVNDTTIRHFTITANNTQWSLYSNGISYASGLVSGSPNIFNRIGLANDIIRDNRFNRSMIFNAQAYNRALTSTEVLQNFNATRARFGI